MEETLAMLASVDPLSRPTAFQPLLKILGPKGELEPDPDTCGAKGLRCGKEPARRRERSVVGFSAVVGVGSRPGEDDGCPYGLCDRDGLEVLKAEGGRPSNPFAGGGPVDRRDGSVPARARRVEGTESGFAPWGNSGKPSVGDSGMFSRRGVEFPLVGGPVQGLTGSKPS